MSFGVAVVNRRKAGIP